MTCILPESVVVRLWENFNCLDVSRDILHNEENEPEPQSQSLASKAQRNLGVDEECMWGKPDVISVSKARRKKVDDGVKVGIHVIDDVTYSNVLVKDAGGIPLDLHRSSAVISTK
nr:16072_t:CDS:2 [Entrophospora candida]CAG8513360.1 3578_t:CDS:2 [Entrophospora candida]